MTTVTTVRIIADMSFGYLFSGCASPRQISICDSGDRFIFTKNVKNNLSPLSPRNLLTRSTKGFFNCYLLGFGRSLQDTIVHYGRLLNGHRAI